MEDLIIAKTYIPVEKITEGLVQAKTPIIIPQEELDKLASENPDYRKEVDKRAKALDYCNISYIAYDPATKDLFVYSVLCENGTLLPYISVIDCSTMREKTFISTEALPASPLFEWANFKSLLSDYYSKQNWKNQLKRKGK